MQSSITLAIIVDTNVFTPSKNKTRDLSKLPLDEYYKILKTLELNDLKYEIDILFPEVVLLELFSHHKKKLSNEIKELKKINRELINFENIQIEGFDDLDVNYYCEELKNKYFNELKIINIPAHKGELFENILDMSLNKKAPFIEGKSDKGFKDSILFLSLLKFAENHRYDKYVLFTKDKGFTENKELPSQFYNHVKQFRKFDSYNKLEIINDKNIMKYIDEEFELFKDLRDYISKEFFSVLYEKYEDAVNITIQLTTYDVNECELIEDDTTIHQLGENEFEVEFFIHVYFSSYNCPSVFDEWEYFDRETRIITQSESYIFRKDGEKWSYELNSRVYEIDFYQ